MSKVLRRTSSYISEAEGCAPTCTEVATRPPLQGATEPETLLNFEQDVSFCTLGCSIMKLFFPIFSARLAWVGMKTTDTALMGHAGTAFLSASSLADFWTGAFSPLMMDGVLGSKCGPAYGAENYDMVGIWTQVSMTLYAWMCIPVMLAFFLTGPALQAILGVSDEIAGYGSYYAAVLAICLPARLISGKISSFFNCQAITRPSFVTTILSLVLNLVFGLQFVLGIPFAGGPKYGFWACPIVTTLVEYFITGIYIIVFCVFLRYHDKCWGTIPSQWNPLRDIFLAPLCASKDDPRFAYYNEHIRPKLREYAGFALPANVAMASDFWRMSAIGILAGTLGTKEVAVFNASYRLAWMNITVIGSFSSAAMIQLGMALGTGDGNKCKRIIAFGVSSVVLFLCITTALTAIYVKELGGIFSSDPEVIGLFAQCAWPMGGMIFFMSFSMHFELILYTVGKSGTVAKAALAGSWLGQVPAVILMLQLAGTHLQSVYIGVGIGYAFYFILVFVPFCGIDWQEQAEIKFDENKKKEPLLA